MLKKNVVTEDVSGAPAITPDILAKIRKQDMKQAIVERFSIRAEVAAPKFAARSNERSPYWQAADEEC